MFKNILVAVDGSPNSKRAVDAAANLALCWDASVILLHVIPDLPLPREILDMITSGEITESGSEILRTSADIILTDARERLAKAGHDKIKTEAVVGNPARIILEYADRNNSDLIIIGHRGLDTQTNMLGSVARKLINMTDKSCLVVG